MSVFRSLVKHGLRANVISFAATLGEKAGERIAYEIGKRWPRTEDQLVAFKERKAKKK